MLEAFLAKAVAEARGADKLPFGKALVHVLQSEAAIWQQRDTLVLRREYVPKITFQDPPCGSVGGYASGRDNRGGNDRSSQQSSGRGQGANAAFDGKVGNKPIKTRAKDQKGRFICKPFNDNRGCRKGRDCSDVHCCNALVNGRVCADARHSRAQHEPSKHGNVEKRQ